MAELIDLLLHVDRYLLELVANYGVWIYAILFLIVFAETGLVVTPFLPGDSLLFADGRAGSDRGPRRLARRVPVAGRSHRWRRGELRGRPVGRVAGDPSVAHAIRAGGAGSIRTTSPARTPSSSGAAARRSCWDGSCRSSGRSCPSSPVWPRCRTPPSRCTT